VHGVARAACAAAKVLHAAGLVHRDFREANIVCVEPGQWMVVDLELAAYADNPVPPGMRLPWWGADALDECSNGAGVFSRMSDMYMIGCMLERIGAGRMGHGALQFVEQLKAKQLSAHDACQHSFMASPPS
jgi:serine/threonine protein kinase